MQNNGYLSIPTKDADMAAKPEDKIEPEPTKEKEPVPTDSVKGSVKSEDKPKKNKWGVAIIIPKRSKSDSKRRTSDKKIDYSPSAVWTTQLKSFRNLVSFWLFGLTNNFGYVIMLSAAYDLLAKYDTLDKDAKSLTRFNRKCNEMSTGAILLANIIPSFFAKAIAPFIPLWIHLRMAVVVSTAILGLVIVGLANKSYLIIVGVAFVSFASGLGETSLLTYTVFFKTRNVISTWSSGTGAAGLIGAFAYSFLIQIGLTPSTTILMMIVMPTLMGVCFWVILDRPKIEKYSTDVVEVQKGLRRKLLLRDKIKLMPLILWKYTLPYGLVYFFEYFINQGLFELMQFPRSFLTIDQQYRWYNAIYQLGVFLSRSSMNVIQIDYIWMLALFQCINVVVFLCEVLFGYMKFLSIPMAIILWEGLLGGWGYVNTFRLIATQRPEGEKEFSMALNAIGDSIMITLAGIAALPVHDMICMSPPPYS